MDEKTSQSNKTQKKLIIFSVLGIVSVAAIMLLCLPYFEKLFEPEYQEEFKEWINSLGIGGWLVVFGVQFLQIVIAFIPGEPIEVIAGVLYGTWGGLILCLLGCLAASALVFSISKRFGIPLLYKLFGKNKVDNFSFLKNEKKVETVAFILFLIPGTPKDMLTYIAGVSNLKLRRFLLIATFARIPSIVSSTLIGSSMRQGNWQMTIVIFVITAIIGLLGIRFNDKIISSGRNIKQMSSD